MTKNDYNRTFLKEKERKCCAIPNIISSNGYEVCTNCGTTQSRIISYSPPTKMFFEREKNYINFEPVRSPFGPRTLIKGNLDGKGNFLSPFALRNYKRLSKINRGLVNGLERNLWIAMSKLDQIRTNLNLPNYIIENTFRIYLIAAKAKLTRGRTIYGIISVSLYFELKRNKIPIIIDELLSAFQISKKKFVSCYRALFTEMAPVLNLNIYNFTPQDYIDKFYDELDLSLNSRNNAIKIIKASKMKGLITSGKDPKGIAAASLYYVSKKNGEFRTQKQICKIANISEITLRTRLKEINSLI
ncbi:MAG: transcription initiation factor IIB family protein [Promethearchaeota archaeon]